MAKNTYTYNFKYRFRCEHCDQTTPWLDACFTETTEDYSFEHFLKQKVPAWRKEIAAGKYDAVGGTMGDGLIGRCPNCQKRQSWEKVPADNIPTFIIGVFFSGCIAAGAWYYYNVAAKAGNEKGQLVWMGVAVVMAIIAMIALLKGISARSRKADIKRNSKDVTIHRKPEFNYRQQIQQEESIPLPEKQQASSLPES